MSSSFAYKILLQYTFQLCTKASTTALHHFCHHRHPRTIPISWLMNALFVLRPAKLWAFNIGHPCPSLAKGSWLAARLACFKYYYYSRHPQRPNLTKFICRKTEGSPALNLSTSAITPANNPSVTVPKNSVRFCSAHL